MRASPLFKVFIAAVKETPRLYFAPIVEALRAVNGVEEIMVNGRSRVGRRGHMNIKSNKTERSKTTIRKS